MKKNGLLVLIIMLAFLFPYCGQNSQAEESALNKKNEQNPQEGKKWDKQKGEKRERGNKNGNDAPLVQIEQSKRQPINAFLVLNGVVEPERKVDVYSRLSAYVKQILREEGDQVKKDEPLALLDDTEIRINHKQAQLQLEQAKLTLQNEEINLKRVQELLNTKMIAEQEFQAVQATYNKAKLDFLSKQENFKDLELQLGYTRIKAPVEGYITARTIEVGSRVNVNQQVYTIEDFSPLLVKVFVPSTDIVNLKQKMVAEISTDAMSGKMFEGKIKLIHPRIDEQSGTVKVTLEVFDNTRQLKPGMFVETKILINNTPNALVVPKKSLNYKDNQAFVFVFDKTSREVSKRVVKTGIAEKDVVEILEGLQEGEPVITVGAEVLKDKMKVNILR